MIPPCRNEDRKAQMNGRATSAGSTTTYALRPREVSPRLCAASATAATA